jgi:hypothetical protein
MAKRKSNRAARRVLAYGVNPTSFRISNTRVMCHSGNMPFIYAVQIKPSAKQSRKVKEIAAYRAELAEAQEETAKCAGCNKRGEPNQKDGGFYCYGSDRCCP